MGRSQVLKRESNGKNSKEYNERMEIYNLFVRAVKKMRAEKMQVH
jgi:hypothetical protein